MGTPDPAPKSRTATILILIVVGLIAALVVALIWINASMPKIGESAYDGAYAGGKPIAVTDEGVGISQDDAREVTVYFSYSCPHCVTLEQAAGPALMSAAARGDIEVRFAPVLTMAMPYTYAATEASLVVAEKDPDHWAAFHEALLEHYATTAASDNADALMADASALEEVRAVAKDVGVRADAVDTFTGTGAAAYLQEATESWSSLGPQGRGDRFGTPELVVNGAIEVPLQSFEAADVLAAITSVLEGQ